MKWKNRIGRSFSIILALSLVMSVNFPAIAWGAEDEPPSVVAGGEPNSLPKAVQEFDALIEALPDVAAVTAADADAVSAALKAYDELDEADKLLVAESYAKLEALSAALDALNEPEQQGERSARANNGADGINPDAVAQVGEGEHAAMYATLQEAIDAAQAGETVKLLSSVSLGDKLVIENKNIVLDLSGFSLGRAAGVMDTLNSALVVQNGTVEGAYISNGAWVAAITVGRGTNLTIASDATVTGPFGIAIGKIGQDAGDEATAGAGTVVDIYGTVSGTSDQAALAWSGAGAITINGGVTSTASRPQINVHEGAVLTGTRGTDENVNYSDAPAIYAAGFGEWTIEDGATLAADEPLSIKSGRFFINGGEFVAKGVYCDPAHAYSSGTEATGAAISITNNKDYARQVYMEITGGSFTSENGYAFYESDSEGNEGSAMLASSSLSITGGTFIGTAGPLYSKHLTGFARGGTYSSDVSDYLGKGYVVKESDGAFIVERDQVATVTKPDGTKTTYDTLQSAISKARNGDVVTLLKNVPAVQTLYAPTYSITVDLNGFTVDSTKYTTFDLNKYSGPMNVTIKNGTIANSTDGEDNTRLGMAVKVRQDVNLTLENVVLDTTRVAEGVPTYGLRIGNGPSDSSNPSVTIKGASTRIVGADAGVAVIGSNAASRSSLILEDGVVEGGSFGIAGNGECDGTSIEIKGGEVLATSADGTAIYHPQNGDLTISGGALSGANGVQFGGAGKLDISGGSIEATAEAVTADPSATSASILDGAALSFVSRGGEYGAAGSAEVAITGGALTSANNAAIQEYAADGCASLIKTLSISQGDGDPLVVKAAVGKPALALSALTGDAAKVVTGGTFSSDPSAYVADGFAARLNDANVYEVTEDAVIEVSGSDGVVRGAYSTFARAIAHAESGDTLKLLADASIAENTIIDKSLTINLNGHTVTNNVAGARAFDVVGNGVELVIDGAVEGSSMVIPGSNAGSYGLFKIDQSAADCKVTFRGGTYSGSTDDGTLLVKSFSSGATSIVLENVIAASSHYLAYADVGGNLNVTVAGGSFTTSNGHAFGFGSPVDDGTVRFEGVTVEANSGYCIEVSGATASFDKCTFTATDAGDPQAPTTAVAVSGNGTVNIESGTYTSNHYGVYVYSSGGTMNVLGGEVSGDVAAVKADANATSYPDPVSVVNISGGTIKGALEPDANSRIHVTGGTFDRLVEEYYNGNIYKQNALNAAVEPGKVVPCSWSIEYNLAGGTLPDGASNPTSYTYLDDDITLVNPERPGYDFAGWTGTGIEGASDTVVIAKGSGDRSYTATWVARTDTPYTVEHWFQNVEGEEYALDEGKTQELSGTTDADTAAVALSETGFTANTFEQQKIAGDGSTVVEIYYDRNVHKVTYVYEGAVPESASALPNQQQLRYGAPVVAAPAAAAPGYTFSGWGVSAGYTMPDEDIVLTGSFTANGDTPYKVEHYLEALDGSYELASTDELKGETDATATAAPKTFTGFTYNPEAAEAVESGPIAGNGCLVLKLYYDRNSYEVSYAYVGTVPAGAPNLPDKAAVKFGATVTPAAVPTLTGYDFSGWSKTAPFEMPVEDVELTGSWKARSDVSYTVHYYLDGTATKLADDKVAEGCTFGSTHAEHAVAITGYTPKGERAQSVVLDAYGKELPLFYTADEARITFETNGGSKADDLVGKTGEPTTGSLPSVTRPGYAFAGWFADKALTQPVEALPATFAAGSITYYAKWNALPLPDADVEIQVEVPQPAEDGSTYAAVPEEAVKAAAEHAQSALEAIGAGEVPAGVSAQDAQAVADVLKSAEADDKVSVIVTLKFEEKAQVDEEEHLAIADAASGDEGVALFLELGVEMTVKVEGDSGTKAQETISLGEVTEPLLFEIHVDPALIQGKSVRIAHVHEGVTEIINPVSVDREQGIVRFYASKFSTYALLTSETVTVTFEPNGGTAVEAQTLKFGERASKPVDPTRDGFSFAGWFSDEGLTQAYDFSAPVERAMTLYAKWTEAGGSGSGGATGDDDATGDVAKPLPQTAKKLVPTGDGTGTLASSAALLVVLAGAVAVAASIRRRNRG